MIVELTVENLAIIERAQLSLGPGFTVLTGETGAGKSLLVDAIELALGERADTELVRSGASRASVSVVLDLSLEPEALAKCRDLGIEPEDGTLYIQRDIALEGRSQCRVAGRLTPVSTLKQLGQLLVDLHGQHDHQSLLNSDRHVAYLDAWIGKPAEDLLREIAQKYAEAEDSKRKLRELRANIRDREHRLDLLRFQIREIEDVDPQPGELVELEAQISRLQHAEKLANGSIGALQELTEVENCAADRLAGAVKALEDLVRFDLTIEDVVKPLREALYHLEDGTHALRGYTDGLEADPAKLEDVAARIDRLRRLRRKYGEDESAILAFLLEARNQLAVLEDYEASESDLESDVERLSTQLTQISRTLTNLRVERAREFTRLVTVQLRDLAMERAEFDVVFRSRPPDAGGADDVEFVFTANAGEPARPLSRIASGGEISRTMLAIKTVLSGRAGVPTLVFDEVEAGLGGKAAATVARKLEELSTHYQVLVISHLPQIASRARTHYRIEKSEANGRVVTRVRLLDAEQRVEEVARMLAGEHVTSTAIANAREMLSNRLPATALFE